MVTSLFRVFTHYKTHRIDHTLGSVDIRLIRARISGVIASWKHLPRMLRSTQPDSVDMTNIVYRALLLSATGANLQIEWGNDTAYKMINHL